MDIKRAIESFESVLKDPFLDGMAYYDALEKEFNTSLKPSILSLHENNEAANLRIEVLEQETYDSQELISDLRER